MRRFDVLGGIRTSTRGESPAWRTGISRGNGFFWPPLTIPLVLFTICHFLFLFFFLYQCPSARVALP